MRQLMSYSAQSQNTQHPSELQPHTQMNTSRITCDIHLSTWTLKRTKTALIQKPLLKYIKAYMGEIYSNPKRPSQVDSGKMKCKVSNLPESSWSLLTIAEMALIPIPLMFVKCLKLHRNELSHKPKHITKQCFILHSSPKLTHKYLQPI